MRRTALLLLLLAAACERQPARSENTQSAAPAAPQTSAKVDRSHAGAAAPQTEFDDPDGETVTLASFEGKPVLLNFWATWCAPCVKEMPTLDRLAARQSDKLQVIALSQDTGGREPVDAFFSKAGLKALEPYMDPKLALMGELRVDVLPTTILFDAGGREVWRVTGEEDWTGARAAALIAQASSVSRAAAR
jgi:thiol-disulfide isomerase/thioredoxin